MKVSQTDIYHGPIVAQLADCPAVISIDYVNRQTGQVLVNGDRNLLLKYTTQRTVKGKYTTSFTKEQVNLLKDFAATTPSKSFVVVNCAQHTICALSFEEFREVIDIDKDATQWISVEFHPNGSMRVEGSKGRLQYVVHHNSFPSKIVN